MFSRIAILSVMILPITGLAADVALTNARVIVGDGEVINHATVVVSGDRIEAVLEGDHDVEATQRIDALGKTVMPGLIDVHVHLGARGGKQECHEDLREKMPCRLKEYLRHGVTTVKSTGDPLSLMLQLRTMLRQGLPGPRVLFVGPVFTATNGHPASTLMNKKPWVRSEGAVQVDDASKARAEVRRVAKQGVDAIKLVYHGGPHPEFIREGVPMMKMKSGVMKAIIDEARNQGLRVTAHTWHEQDAIAVIESGGHGVEHGVGHALLEEDKLGAVMKEKNAFYVPTLGILRFSMLEHTQDTAKKNLKRLVDAGVKVALGTDSTNSLPQIRPGLTTIQELEVMADAGLSNAQIIAAATRNAAEHLGLLEDLGTVEKGKIADLIIVDGDPLADISAMQKVVRVIRAGKEVVSPE